MNLFLSAEAHRLIEEKLRTGNYRTAAEVVLAGLGSLDQQEQFGEFFPDEWHALLKMGEESLIESEPIDAQKTIDELKARIGNAM
jgi:Arc/MetJ-type ribon-helix-helix transcriptional regulator